MDEKKRTKLLAGALALVVGFGFIRPDRILLDPIRKAQNDLQIADSSKEAEDLKQMELMVAKELIEQGQRTSLSPRTSDAQRLYQSWITNLAEQCKFAQLIVTPGNRGNLRDQYLTVDVNIEAETDLSGLSRFLYLFEQAELMHRISSIEITSTGSTGNPRMEVQLTAEGMSVAGSPQRSDVFARTSLSAPMDSTATELTVAESADFREELPFKAQIGREMVTVTATAGNTWTVERGQEGTSAAAHNPDEVVQLFPVPPLKTDRRFADYEPLLNASPFVKPTPPKSWQPRLAGISDQTIAPGETVKITAKAEDFNPDVGAIAFALDDAVDGMTIDPETGSFEWVTAADLEPKRYETKIVLTQKNNPDLRVEKSVGIDVQLPNEAPKIVVPEKAIVVLGRDFSLSATAEDDGPADALRFSLDGEVPSGLTVDETAGQLKWTPPNTFQPGEYIVTVKVTDGGTPSKTASENVTLSVQDDDAALTKFTGSVTLDGVPKAWFRNFAKKLRPELQIGDRIVAADINAELTEISSRHVMMKDSEGIWKLNLGDSLRDRILVEPAQKPDATEAAAAAEKSPEATPTTESTPPAEAPPQQPDEPDQPPAANAE